MSPPAKIVHVLALLPRRLQWRAAAVVPLLVATALLEASAAVSVMLLMRILSEPGGGTASDVFSLVAFLPPGETTPRVLLVVGFVALLYLTKNALWMIVEWLRHHTLAEAATVVAQKLLEAALEQDWTVRLKQNSADQVRTIDQDATSLFRHVVAPSLAIVSEVFTVVAVGIVLLTASPAITAAAALVLGTVGVLFIRGTRRLAERDGLQVEERGRALLLQLQHAFGASKELKVSGRQAVLVRSFTDHLRTFSRTRARQDVLSGLPRMTVETVFVIGLLVMVPLVTLSDDGGAHTVSLLALYAYAGFRLVPSANRILWQWTQVRFHAASIRPLFDGLARIANRAEEAAETPPGLRFGDAIRLESVSVRYDEGEPPALRSVTLVIPCGSSVGIIGPTGAGKTTLVDALLGLLPVASGRITIDGVDLAQCRRWWQRRIGYVPQAPYLLDDTVRRNVALGVADGEIDERRVREVLRIARLDRVIEDSRQGLETRIGEGGLRLSGGERQRLGIARALYGDPEVLVLDEATSALDGETEAALLGAVAALPGRRTLVRVAHRLATVSGCDRLVLLRDGELTAVGSYEELRARSQAFRAFLSGGLEPTGPSADPSR